MLRGDVDRFYHNLRRKWPKPQSLPLPALDHVREIAQYYRQMPKEERTLMLAWARKEEAGIGLIPLALSGVPLLSLLFAPLFQGLVRGMPTWGWATVWASGIIALVLGFWIHQRQRAITALHIHLLEHLCKEQE